MTAVAVAHLTYPATVCVDGETVEVRFGEPVHDSRGYVYVQLRSGAQGLTHRQGAPHPTPQLMPSHIRDGWRVLPSGLLVEVSS